MNIKVPYHKQKTDYFCGPATLAMAINFFGHELTQTQIARIAGLKISKLKKEGTSNGKLVNAARKLGFYCYVNNEATMDELKYYINKKLPVIINYIEPRSMLGHFSVVIGYNQLTKKIIILNPDIASKKILKMSEGTFLKYWRGGYQKCNNWMMIISKKEFKVGKQFAPLKK